MGVVDRALVARAALAASGALERLGAERADLEAVLAALERLDGAERGAREEHAGVDLAHVDARGGLDGGARRSGS